VIASHGTRTVHVLSASSVAQDFVWHPSVDKYYSMSTTDSVFSAL